jgi:plasmid maintenance system antidote protein VapI
MPVMPPTPRKAVMSPEAFRSLLKKVDVNHTQAAKRLGVGRATVLRWLNGTTPISRANARLIRDEFGPKM